MIRYTSTRHNAPAATFEEALFRGLAPDGGLYFPNQFPRFSAAELAALCGAELPTVAAQVLGKWFGDEISRPVLEGIAREAHSFPIPLRRVGDLIIMELFHGPTLAFKDVAAQNLPRLMSYFLQQRAQNITLLVATSGDTGGAVAHGFADVPHIRVVVLFPKGRVSGLQQEQLTRVADNVVPVEVDGVFDDCQALVKRAFTDPALADLRLTSANSISIGRLIPQIIYYVYAYAQLCRDDLAFIVPSGNFGNLTGGLFAREMGVPLHHFIAANNVNDAATRYIETGHYAPRETVATLSNAMDVGAPSNFARVLALFDHEYEAVRDVVTAYRVDDATTVQTIQAVQAEHDVLLDPHTAVGWHVATKFVDPALTRVLVATASPVKFAHELRTRAGIEVDDLAEIARLRQRPARKVSLPNSYEALAELLLGLREQ